MELISVPKILPASPNFTNLCLHRKSENVCDQESYKMTTKGQRPWLGIHRIFMGRVLAELSSWTVSRLLISSHEPSKVRLYVSCTRQRPRESAQMESSPRATGSNAPHRSLPGNEKGTMARRGVGVGMKESQWILKQLRRPRSICQNGIHP